MAIKRILVFRNDRFGELLLNIPVFRALKAYFKDATISLVVDTYAVELARCIPFVDTVIPWQMGKSSLGNIINLARSFKKDRYDLAVVLNPHKESHLICFLAGIPLRLGYSRKWGFLLTRRIKDEKHQARKHEVEYNLDLVRALGVDTDNTSLELTTPPGLDNVIAKRFGLDEKRIMIAVHPFTSDPVKQWTMENFIKLITLLGIQKDVLICVVGSGALALKESFSFENLGATIVNLIGKTTLVELSVLLKMCVLLISGDSGPVHLARSVNTPVLALFRNDLPGKTALRWGPWGEGNLVIERDNLSKISVEEVYKAAKEKLKVFS